MSDLPPEVVIDGRKQVPGTTVERKSYPGGESMILRHPSGSDVQLVPGQTVSVDGVVVSGPLKGWRVEQRPVGNDGRLLREVFFKGDHGPFCDLTGDGWICREGCTVEDARQEPRMTVALDTLKEIVSIAQRHWLRVEWALIRVSECKRFVNGRCRIPGSVSVRREVWHLGRTWTKRGARRRMKSLSEPR